MASLYLVELDIDYQGTKFEDFLKIWLEEVNFYLEQKKPGIAKHLFKAAAERKVYMVLETTSEQLDVMLLTSSPLMKKLGDQVKVTTTQLLPYETFANNMHTARGDEREAYPITAPVEGKGDLYFWVDFKVGYTGHSLDDILRIWCEEAAAAIGGKGAGLIVDFWKCVGMRRVPCLCRVESADFFDNLLSFGLPIMKQNGCNMKLDVKAVRPFETLAQELTKLTSPAQ